MRKTSVVIGLAIFLVWGLIFAAPCFPDTPKKVVILPFSMNAKEDLSYLREGIQDMLASRLYAKGKVEVVEKEKVKEAMEGYDGPLNRAYARELARELGADYALLGSVTVFGESVSVDASMVSLDKEEAPVTVFAQTKGMDSVIPEINDFAWKVNAQVFGRTPPPPERTSGEQYASTKGPPQEAPPKAPPQPSTPGALTRAKPGPGGMEASVQAVLRIGQEIVGLDAGDVDGDGTQEIVVINKDTVSVYKLQEDRFSPLARFEKGWSPNYVYVDVADMDQNGRAEIYVSNLTSTGVSSLVLEWEKDGLKKISDGLDWFVRVLDLPGSKGPRLIGQKRMAGGGFTGKVYTLKRVDGDYSEGEPVELPRLANVFNFAVYSQPDGGELFVLLGPTEHLRVYQRTGGGFEEIWKSSEQYGGALTYMEVEAGGDVPIGDFVFFPSPIHISDIDQDGEKEVMICRNLSPLGLRLTEKLRVFKAGKVHFLTWSGAGLEAEWTSKKTSGAIVGYVNIQDKGSNRLVIGAMGRTKKIVGHARSQVVVYTLSQ